MRLMIWLGDEGPTDLDLKDGDIWAVRDNAWVPGAQELKKWLIVEMAEYGGQQSELVTAEYTTGQSAPVQRHARKYQVRYWEKLDPEELALWRDKTQTKAILAGRFDIWDIVRK
jgi:hypothetical protein